MSGEAIENITLIKKLLTGMKPIILSIFYEILYKISTNDTNIKKQ